VVIRSAGGVGDKKLAVVIPSLSATTKERVSSRLPEAARRATLSLTGHRGHALAREADQQNSPSNLPRDVPTSSEMSSQTLRIVARRAGRGAEVKNFDATVPSCKSWPKLLDGCEGGRSKACAADSCRDHQRRHVHIFTGAARVWPKPSTTALHPGRDAVDSGPVRSMPRTFQTARSSWWSRGSASSFKGEDPRRQLGDRVESFPALYRQFRVLAAARRQASRHLTEGGA